MSGRCLYLSRCYTPVHKYAEALTLIQYANIHLRETRSIVSSLDPDPITSGNPAYYPLSSTTVDQLETDLSALGLQLKKDWFAYNGGSANPDNNSYQKPLFFDIALNYVQLDTDRLQERAGKKLAVSPQPYAKGLSGKIESQQEKKQTPKAKVEAVRAETPEPQAPARSGLSSLLGGWWGKS
jgi:signal recognition particle subunit SRP68